MKKLYTILALVGLSAVGSSNSRFYGAGRQALPYARQAVQRMFTSGKLPQATLQQMRGQTPGFGRRFMSQQASKKPMIMQPSRPQVQPGAFARYWPNWQAARGALAQRWKQSSEMIKRYPKLFTGGALAGTGAWLGSRMGPVLAEEEKEELINLVASAKKRQSMKELLASFKFMSREEIGEKLEQLSIEEKEELINLKVPGIVKLKNQFPLQ